MSYRQCTAKSKRTGERCKAHAVTGRDVCYHHGGKTPRGLANPHTKTGLYSKDLPTRLQSSYETLLQLGDRLFRLEDETAAITSLAQDALSRIDSGESGAAWRRIADLHQQMEAISRKDEQTAQDMTDYAAAFEEIGRISRQKSMAWAARDEAVKLMEQKRRFVGDERKARTEAYKAISYDRVMLLLAAVVNGFKLALDRFADDETKNNVLIEGQKIVSRVLGENGREVGP